MLTDKRQIHGSRPRLTRDAERVGVSEGEPGRHARRRELPRVVQNLVHAS